MIGNRVVGADYMGFAGFISGSAANEQYKKALTNIIVYALNR